MTVGVVTQCLDRSNLTGPGVYLYHLLDCLLDLPEAASKVQLIHYRSFDNPLYHRAREVVVPQLPGLSELAIRREAPNLLHYNSLPTLRPFYLVPAKKVLTLHGMGTLIAPWAYPVRARIERKYLWPFLIKAVDSIIAVSEFTRQAAIQHWNVDPEQIFTIHSGVSESFRSQSEQAVNTVREKVGNPYILHVSNYHPIKNSATLVEAFAKLKSQKFPHSLVIVGGRWQSSPIPALVTDLSLDKHVHFVGYASSGDLSVWYSGADAFVTLSLHESFCFPVVEAMACGCPVIAPNRTAFPEILADAGILLELPDEPDKVVQVWAQVLEDDDLRMQLRERGLKRARKFSWRENAQKTWDVYESLF